MDLNGPAIDSGPSITECFNFVFVSPHLCPSNALYTDISAAIIGILGLTRSLQCFRCQWGSLGFKVTLGLQESFGICLFDLAKSEKSGVSSLETIYIYIIWQEHKHVSCSYLEPHPSFHLQNPYLPKHAAPGVRLKDENVGSM